MKTRNANLTKEQLKEYHRESQKRFADKNRKYYRKKNEEHNKKNKMNGYHTNRQQEYAKKNPEKIKAHNLINNTKRKEGNTKEERCIICGSTEHLVAHHPDYSEPMKVMTLCKEHHYEIHKK